MRKNLLAVCALLLLCSCSQEQMDRQDCLNLNLKPDTKGFNHCLLQMKKDREYKENLARQRAALMPPQSNPMACAGLSIMGGMQMGDAMMGCQNPAGYQALQQQRQQQQQQQQMQQNQQTIDNLRFRCLQAGHPNCF